MVTVPVGGERRRDEARPTSGSVAVARHQREQAAAVEHCNIHQELSPFRFRSPVPRVSRRSAPPPLAAHFPSLAFQRAISVFDGSFSSNAFRAVSMPAIG